MKKIILALLLSASFVFADTPPPGSVKIKDTNGNAINAASGSLSVNVSGGSFALPVGASTSALQTTGNASLSSIDGKLTSPLTVSLPTGASNSALQSTGNSSLSSIDSKLTSPLSIQGGNSTAVKVDGSAVTQPVSVSSLPLPTGAATSALQTQISAQLPTTLGAKTIANSLAVNVASDQTVPVSAASLPLPSGASTAANQATGNTSLASIDSKLTSPIAIQGGNSTAVKVDGSLVTQPVSAVSLPLPTGAATSALQSQLSAQLPTTLGAKTTANSLAINVASDQIVPVSASALPLPSGASTSALQTAGNSSLSSIDGKLTSPISIQGGNSSAVKVDGSAVTQPVSAASLPLPTNASTASNQTTANASLSSIDGKLTAPLATKSQGKSAANLARIDYTGTPVTTAAYVQLLASTSALVSEVEIFDSSGQTLVLATGAAGFEVDQIYIFPGGNGKVPLSVASSTRVSIKAVSATASTGEIDVNFYQ